MAKLHLRNGATPVARLRLTLAPDDGLPPFDVRLTLRSDGAVLRQHQTDRGWSAPSTAGSLRAGVTPTADVLDRVARAWYGRRGSDFRSEPVA